MEDLPKPSTDMLERFERDWRAVAGAAHAGRVLIALSGGGDSSALLLLFAAAGRGGVFAATVDHGIRPEAAGEAVRAGALAAECGVPHVTLVGVLPDRSERTANLSTRARAVRYRLLEEQADAIGARWIVTAHHADDQLETMTMRLARGAGLRGLCGIRARQGRVARPLLGWRRAELAAIVAGCGVVPVADPSNGDDRFDRARLRKVLAEVDWLDAGAASRSAGALAQAEEAIGWMVDRLAGERCRIEDGQVRVRADDLPAELRRRLVEQCLGRIDPAAAPRGADVGRALDRLASGAGGTLGGVRYDVAAGGEWRFRPAPPRRAHRPSDLPSTPPLVPLPLTGIGLS